MLCYVISLAFCSQLETVLGFGLVTPPWITQSVALTIYSFPLQVPGPSKRLADGTRPWLLVAGNPGAGPTGLKIVSTPLIWV